MIRKKQRKDWPTSRITLGSAGQVKRTLSAPERKEGNGPHSFQVYFGLFSDYLKMFYKNISEACCLWDTKSPKWDHKVPKQSLKYCGFNRPETANGSGDK